ncbi:MAG: hypothetical protein AAB429_03520 [Patescibacteria group bacterium]
MSIVHPLHRTFDLLAIVGVLAVIGVVVVLLVNPARRLQEARDDRRQRDVVDIFEAMVEYRLLHDGAYPAGLDDTMDTFQVLGSDAVCDVTCPAETSAPTCLDLSAEVAETALGAIPTGRYAVNLTDNGKLEVIACDPEVAERISVKH